MNDANNGNANEDSNYKNNEEKDNDNNNKEKVPSLDDSSNAADYKGDENDEVDNNKEEDHEDLNAANIPLLNNINYTSLGGTEIALGTTNLLLSYYNNLFYTGKIHHNLLMERLAISLCMNLASIHTTSIIPPEPSPL